MRFKRGGDSLLSIIDPGTIRLWRARSWAEIEAAEQLVEAKTAQR